MELSVYILLPLAIFAIYVVKSLGKFVTRKNTKIIAGKHVVITGACSGAIGKSVATLAVQKGANVTLIGWNKENLIKLQKQLLKQRICKDQNITAVLVNTYDRQAINTKLNDLEEARGAIYMLINCDGFTAWGNVESFTKDDIQLLIQINYLGALYPIQNVIPKFKQRREGIIVLTGSHLSLMGMFGYAIYSSCKFALRGLAESIHFELKPYNVSVTLSLPLDTSTPRFDLVTKETQLNDSIQQDDTAKQLLEDALNGKFFSCPGWKCYFVTSLSVGTLSVLQLVEVFAEWLQKVHRFAAFCRAHVQRITHQYYARGRLEN